MGSWPARAPWYGTLREVSIMSVGFLPKDVLDSPQQETPDKPTLRDTVPGAWLGVLHKSQCHERQGE